MPHLSSMAAPLRGTGPSNQRAMAPRNPVRPEARIAPEATPRASQ